MSSKEQKNIEKQIEKHQKKIQEIKEKSEKLNQQFNNINEFEKNIQPLYNMPNTRKKTTTKSVTKSVTKSRKPSTEEQRERWRESKKRQKIKKNEKLNQQSLIASEFELFDINEEDSIMDSPVSLSSSKYRSPPPIIKNNPFQNEMIRFDHDAEKKMFEEMGDAPLSVENTPTKSKRGGKTRKNKKR